MLRTQISLTESERAALDAEAARTGRSVAALIRDAVDAHYGLDRDLDDELAAIDESFGAWTGRDRDSASWVEQLRAGRPIEVVE